MIGTTLAHYRITAALGAGGMGEVWRATDTKLGREVAVKVLPEEFAGDPDRLERFEREARAVAALNHPHIVTIYSVEDSEGVRFLTMELIEGRSLDKLIPDSGLGLKEFFELATPLAEAISAAHDKSVIHRDLKPTNVMVDGDGRVKVLDFGLAKLQETSEPSESSELPTEALTGVGMIMGTVPYMSPEQIEGKIVDHRTDVFSLGVLLYEMAVGERPFQGESSPGLMSSILKDVPTPLMEIRSDLPRQLGRIIGRCLEKDRRDRYQTSRDVFNELKALQREASTSTGAAASGHAAVPSGGVAPSPPSLPPTAQRPVPDQAFAATQQVSAETKSIVVLPFANLSPDPDTEYFSDGLTDEIITDLSQVQALRVISRSSAMRLKGDERGLAAIGRDLDCQYVLEGSVRRAANTLRITARLVDPSNDVQLWADKYRGTLDDVFDIQERVSRSIVDALEIRLTPQEAEQLAERPIPDVRAQECYLRARREIWSFLPGALEKAISHLEAGLALIGDNPLLYQGLGEAYFQSINIGAAGGREEEYIKKAESCAEKIFAIEPESTRGFSVRAHLQLARGDIHGCARSWRRVLQAFPKDVQALQLSAHILGWLGGKPDAAAPLAERLVDIDPLDPMSRLASVTVPLFAGRFSEALEPGRRMFDLDPVTPVWRSNYVMALSYNQRLDEAEALTEGVVAQPDSDIGTWWMGLCRAAWREDRAEVLRLADGPYQQAAAWDAEIPWVLASTHAAVGATEEALLWLDRAIDQGMINYPFLSEHDHYLDSVRGDVRFGRAMGRARREWERFDV